MTDKVKKAIGVLLLVFSICVLVSVGVQIGGVATLKIAMALTALFTALVMMGEDDEGE